MLVVKNPGPGFDPWVGKIPWSRKLQPTSVFFRGKIPWTEELWRATVHGGHTESETTEHAHAYHIGLFSLLNSIIHIKHWEPCLAHNNNSVALARNSSSSTYVCVLAAQSCPTPCNPVHCICQASLSMELSRQEYWSGLPFPSPGDLPSPGIKAGSPALQADPFLSEPPGKPTTAALVATNISQSWVTHSSGWSNGRESLIYYYFC